MGGPVGSSMSPFQTSMSSTVNQSGMGQAMGAQKSTGLFGSEPKTTTNSSGNNPFKPKDPFSSEGPGILSMDHTAGIRTGVGCMCDAGAAGEGGNRRIRREEGLLYK